MVTAAILIPFQTDKPHLMAVPIPFYCDFRRVLSPFPCFTDYFLLFQAHLSCFILHSNTSQGKFLLWGLQFSSPGFFDICGFPGQLMAAVCLTKFTFASSSYQQHIWSVTDTAPFAVFPQFSMRSDLQGLRPNLLVRAGSHLQNRSFFLEVLTIAFFQKRKVPNTHPSSQSRRLLFKIPWPHAPPGLALEAEAKHYSSPMAAVPWTDGLSQSRMTPQSPYEHISLLSSSQIHKALTNYNGFGCQADLRISSFLLS